MKEWNFLQEPDPYTQYDKEWESIKQDLIEEQQESKIMKVGDRVKTPLGNGIIIENEILAGGYNKRFYVKVDNIGFIEYGFEHKDLTNSLIELQNKNGYLAFFRNELEVI